ncbi:uncharacterized protein LOC126630349 [Malus sylvestris]|uniref:RPW8 domain-containing protein n=1 Tax=Malus domestica TaxID=3750 RepID=A0A498JLI9_MALDO|nr:uncharacterized protein LOC126630349 [Malus sylvestris]RXH94764.1 hypothetical protein DVH24_024448 [Malus domestica]
MDFVLGPGFTVLYDVVKEAMGGELLHFKPLEDLKTTLDMLQPLIIQKIEKLNKELSLPTVEAEDLAKQMKKGAEIVPKFTKLQTWNCMVKCRYTGMLKKLDGCLKTLVDKLKMQDLVVVREVLVVGRQTANDLEKLLEVQEQLQIEKKDIINMIEQNTKAIARLEALLATLTATGPSGKVDLKAPEEAVTLQIGGPKSEEIVRLSESMEAVVPMSKIETELEPVEESIVVQEATLFAGHTLISAFKELLDVLMDVKERTMHFKPLLEGIKSKLDDLEPIERIEKYIKVFHWPKEKLQYFENQLRNGAMLVQKSTKVSTWAVYKKYNYARKLIELDESLHELLNIVGVSEMKLLLSEVRDSMETVRNISAEVSQIEYEIVEA